MKNLILILTLFISLTLQAQISYNPARKLIYVRTIATAHKKPPITQLPEGTWGYCSGDSTVYRGENGQVVAFARMYTYSGAIKNVHAKASEATTANFSSTKKMYYVLYDSINNNLPILADFPTSIYQCINTEDSLWYDKYNGGVRTARVFFPYSEPDHAPVYPTLASRIYVSTSGSDASTNPHNPETPYKTLYNACLNAGTNDTIRIMAGIYIEPNRCYVPVSVSVQGSGKDSTFIIGHYTTIGSSTLTGATLALNSYLPGTNGNQSIFDLTLDGDSLTGSRGIAIKNRSNVKVHDVRIKDFYLGGVNFHSNGIFAEDVPAVYETGNELYNSIITNCGDTPGTWNGNGLILISCQDGLLIHGNTLTENSRVQGHNGNIINAGGRHFKNLKYYNNKSYKSDNEGTAWNFHLEFWSSEGGIQIYDNEFHGGDCAIDVGGRWSLKGSYAYSYSIHDNLFQPISNHGGTSSYHPKNAITVEAWVTEDVFIYDNHFNSWPSPVVIEDAPYVVCSVSRVSFYRNLVENCGFGSGVYSTIIPIQVERVGNTMSDINIYNNTIASDNTGRTMAFAITVGSKSGNTPIAGGTLTNLNIYNNILMYHTNASPIYITNNGTITGLTIENNLSYNLLNYNVEPVFWPYNNGTISGYVRKNNIPVSNTTQQNPLFVSGSDFHLQSGSPAIGAGKGGVNIGKY